MGNGAQCWETFSHIDLYSSFTQSFYINHRFSFSLPAPNPESTQMRWEVVKCLLGFSVERGTTEGVMPSGDTAFVVPHLESGADTDWLTKTKNFNAVKPKKTKIITLSWRIGSHVGPGSERLVKKINYGAVFINGFAMFYLFVFPSARLMLRWWMDGQR